VLTEPVLFGAAYSVYVRAARLTLAEKGVAYRLAPVDVFAPGGPPAEHLARHPFGKIPALEHRGFRLYEAGAITRYVDEAFEGPALQPASPQGRARMNQAISVADSYAYPIWIWGIYVERIGALRRGGVPNEARIAQALPRAETCLAAFEAILGEGPWLAGAALTLADLHAGPMFDLFLQTPEGVEMIGRHDRLTLWWERMRIRPSMTDTAPA